MERVIEKIRGIENRSLYLDFALVVSGVFYMDAIAKYVVEVFVR